MYSACTSLPNAGKHQGKVSEKNEVEWAERVESKKDFSPRSGRTMHGYILTYARLYMENLLEVWVLNNGGP